MNYVAFLIIAVFAILVTLALSDKKAGSPAETLLQLVSGAASLVLAIWVLAS